ncbi:hypothetical protein RR46_03620 [Papilio xuthus]|uniref:Uncharacterized protein n=1 Tax=Papilio xuthus TaxID=66420 RepID=A0A194PZK3_PAPXU|nr:hypothetical protein RR46_03620 [Papilio xuthus]
MAPLPTPIPARRSRGISRPVVSPVTSVPRMRGVGADDVLVKRNYMDSLCKDHFLQRQYRKLDGGVLWSRNERNLDCTVTFQTHSILQRFMLHFDMLQLDCNDHLYVYDGAHATAPPKSPKGLGKKFLNNKYLIWHERVDKETGQRQGGTGVAAAR